MYQLYKVLCCCTTFQGNKNPDKEGTALKKEETSVACAQPLELLQPSAGNLVRILTEHREPLIDFQSESGVQKEESF